jgi:hypothetical protein
MADWAPQGAGGVPFDVVRPQLSRIFPGHIRPPPTECLFFLAPPNEKNAKQWINRQAQGAKKPGTIQRAMSEMGDIGLTAVDRGCRG